jgi:hypothetical protein
MFNFLRTLFVKQQRKIYEKISIIRDPEFDTFSNNIQIIDDWIVKLCPRGSHSEWDMMPIIETEGIREDHAYNTFTMFSLDDKFKIVFEMEENDHWGKLRKEQDKRMADSFGYTVTGFEESRFWILNPDGAKYSKANRIDFYNQLKENNLLDYFNFKMEEVILNNV